MEIFLVYLVFCWLVAYWAGKWGRGEAFFFCLSLLLSPPLAALILFVSGRSNTLKNT